MKKKFVFIIFLLLHFFCFSEVKPYYDITNGYHGYADAIYNGYRTNEYCHQLIDYQMYSFRDRFPVRKHKFSNQQIFLIDSALGEYDICKNEVYVVCLFETSSTYNSTAIVRIINNKGNFEIVDGFQYLP